jgi:hypothetical protein
MKERPILFSAPMVRALLAGTKTQTRRVCKPLASVQREGVHLNKDVDGQWMASYIAVHQGLGGTEDVRQWFPCPYGQPGDRLWVRECFAAWWVTATGKRSHPMGYRADIDDPNWDGFGHDDPWWLTAKWEPSIHMPRAFSRITLEVTEVRVQRLQDITEEECFAEGIPRSAGDRPIRGMEAVLVEGGPLRRDGGVLAPTDCYQSLWDTINGRGAWALNPWIWAITFQRVTP